MKDSGIENQVISQDFLKTSYSIYITRYFQMFYLVDTALLGGQKPLNIAEGLSHTEVVLKVYEYQNNQLIRTDTGF